jgi:GDP-4-dehydro-6-deoxy-D-mannose reductase
VRAFVTGSAGFVGRHLAPRLEAEGFEVLGRDREVDVTDVAALERAIAAARPDAVFHLAAVSSVAASMRHPELAFRVNYLGSRAVLDATARCAPGARVLLVGSSEEYGALGPGDPPVDEEAPLRPRSPYARSKAAADLLGAARARTGLDVVRARAFNHTGPGQSDAFVLSSFAKQLVEIASGRREPRLRVGNLDSVRDFLDVSDVVDAYVALVDRAVRPGVYNIASGIGVRIGDALEQLAEIAGVRPEVVVDPERLRPADVALGDATRLRRATGWAPRVPFPDTLASLVADWRGRLSVS